LREALAIREKILPPIHPRAAYAREGLAVSLGAALLEQPDEGETYLKRALPINQQIFGENSMQAAEVFGHWAFLYGVQKKEADQEASLKQQIAVLEKAPGA
jgi:hypothetical protein